MGSRLVLGIRIAVAIAFAVIAWRALAYEFAALSVADVLDSFERIGLGPVWLSLAATAAGFAAMTPYDALALRYAGKQLSWQRSALSSATTYAVSNLLGFPVFTGNAVRVWLYERWGLGLADVAAAAIVTTVTCNLALALIVGVSLIASPDVAAIGNVMPLAMSTGIGLLLIVFGVTAILYGMFGPARVGIGRFSIARPGRALAPHLAVCTLDYLAAAAVLWFPLADTLHTDFLTFVAMFGVAKLIGVMSNVPGGLGVFEAIIVVMLPWGSEAQLAASLIIYRITYFLLPFSIAAMLLAVHGLGRARRRTSPRRP